MRKVALISGVTGQNGAYPDETLLNKGYVVHGLWRRSSSFNLGRIEHLYQDLHEADVRFFLPNMNAALGGAQLEQLDGFIASKRRLAARYAEPSATCRALRSSSMRISPRATSGS